MYECNQPWPFRIKLKLSLMQYVCSYVCMYQTRLQFTFNLEFRDQQNSKLIYFLILFVEESEMRVKFRLLWSSGFRMIRYSEVKLKIYSDISTYEAFSQRCFYIKCIQISMDTFGFVRIQKLKYVDMFLNIIFFF